jgi:hypothetical protein
VKTDMKLPFEPVIAHLGTRSLLMLVEELRQDRSTVRRWMNDGVTHTEAAAIADELGVTATDLWANLPDSPTLSNGNGAAPTSQPADQTGIIWEDPPRASTGPRRGSPVEAAVISQLKAHPGRWAKVRTWPGRSANACRYRILKGHYPELAVGDWEACAVQQGRVLYLRYIGGDR